MKIKTFRYCLILFLLQSLNSKSQVNLEWSVYYHPNGGSSYTTISYYDPLRIDSYNNIINLWYSGNAQMIPSIGITSFDSNGNLNWEHDYAGAAYAGEPDYMNVPVSCRIDNNDNVYVMGWVNQQSTNLAQDDINIKYDHLGNQLWAAGDDSLGRRGRDIAVIGNNYYNLSRAHYLFRYNASSGVLIDSITVDTLFANNGVANSFMIVNNDSLIVFGWKRCGTLQECITLCKMDTTGSIAWERTLGPYVVCSPGKAIPGKNGGFYLMSGIYNNGTNDFATLVSAHKIDGDTIWTKIYTPAGARFFTAEDIAVDQKGHFYIASIIQDSITLLYNAAIVQYNESTGQKNWEIRLGTLPAGGMTKKSFNVDSAGYIYYGYNTIPPIAGNYIMPFNIVKLDSTGNILWHSTFDTIDFITSFVYDGVNTFYTSGNKLSKYTLVTTAVDEKENSVARITISPNPASDKIYFNNITIYPGMGYIVYDLTGRKILTGRFLYNNVDIHTLKQGAYLLTIQDGLHFYSGKFVKH